jgi:hypothetical protein
MIRGSTREFAKREAARKGRGCWVLYCWEGLRGLTCDFWAKMAKEKSRSPFDFAQGRLCGMTTRKTTTKANEKAKTIDRSLCRLESVAGWNPHLRIEMWGTRFPGRVYTETRGLRNFFAAAEMSTANRTSRRSWATLNGVSVPVGASAWKAGTCSKVCAIRTKTLK